MKKLLILLTFLGSGLLAQQPFYQWSNTLDSVYFQTQKCDSANNTVFILGETNFNTDIDPGPAVVMVSDLFIAKYDLNGLFLGAATFNNTSLSCTNARINIDEQGGLVLVANFTGIVDIDPGPATVNLQDSDGGLLVVRYSNSFQVSWSFVLSSVLLQYTEPAFDQANNMYLLYVSPDSVDFDPSNGFYYLPNNANNFCLLKYNSSGQFVWANAISSSGFFVPSAMDVSGNNRIFITGYFSDTTDIDPGAGVSLLIPNSSLTSVYSTFISCYYTSGALVWGQKFDGPTQGYAYGRAISALANGDFIVSGTFDVYMDLDPGTGTQIVNSPGPAYAHLFLGRYDENGQLIWAFSMGPRYNVDFSAMDIDIQDNIYLSGAYRDTIDLDPGSSTALVINAEQNLNAFLVSYSPAGQYRWSFSTTTPGGSIISDIEAYPNSELGFMGRSGDPIDLDPTSGQIIVAPISPNVMAYQCTFGPSPNGIEDHISNPYFFVFPSPTSGDLQVHFDPYFETGNGSGISIYDIAGRLVMMAPAESGKTIRIGDLQAGVYFVSLCSDKSILTRKIILEK